MVLLVLIVGISYAVYQRETEVTFINAKVGDFRVNLSNITSTSTNTTIDLSYTASGYNASTTCTFGTVKGTYNIGATTVNNSKCTKTGLTQNTAYYYKVCTKNNLKQEVCKEGSINTKYNAPTLSNITATSTANSIKLTYTVSGYAKDYLCKWGTSANNITNIAGMNLSECNITGLTPGVTYYYAVGISNNGGGSSKTGSIATKLNPPTLSNITATSTMHSINLSYTMSGTISSRTCKYGTTNGNYSYTVSNPTNTGCSITGLAENTTYYYQVCGSNSGGQNCKTGSIKTNILLSNRVKVGDYIRMTPTATSYTIAPAVTGYSSNQTINPSELNLWRVIKVNSDGTVEMVSDKVSSVPVYFKGKEGYINLVGGLNIISSAYTDGKNVLRTRHIGYSRQIERITDTSKLSQTKRPWTKMTSINSQWTGCNTKSYLCGTDENLGAGDIGYEIDYQLVNGVYGTMKARKASGGAAEYWLASRLFYTESSTYWRFDNRYVNINGDLRNNWLVQFYNGNITPVSFSKAVRPIVTIKSSAEISSGSGSSSSPYTLS